MLAIWYLVPLPFLKPAWKSGISWFMHCWSLPWSILSITLLASAAAAAAKSLQLCLTLCDPIGGSLPGSPVPGILQARTLEWVAISFSNAWKWKVKVKLLSHVQLLATPWTAAYQTPSSMGFSRQEYWSGVPLPSPENSMEFPLKTATISCSPIPGHISREKHDLKGYIQPKFTGVLFTIASAGKQPKYQPTEEWIKKTWCVCVCVCVYLFI